MSLLLRSLQTMGRALTRPLVSRFDEPVREAFRVLPTDIDVYRHMNHAKYLSYLEAARWGLQVRSGFLRQALKRGWIGPIASLHIEYYRPLKLFQAFEVTTQFIRFDEKWFFILQRFWLGEKEACRALIKGTVRQGRKNVPPSEYLATLKADPTTVSIPTDLADWCARHLAP